MAYNDQEIELKLPLAPEQYRQIRVKLIKKTKFIKSSHHIDDYYTPKHKSFLEPKYPYEWLTLRKRDGKVLLNYKHWYPENTKFTTHCDEYETEISSYESTRKMLKALNFEKIISVNKKRDVFEYKSDLEIALDEVLGLGHFIEVEAIKDFGSVDKARKEILKFTGSLGLKRTKTVPGGYAAELMRRRKLLS
ncbi:MAG: hypothetical protein US60_C0011G0017 [Microgenomates group bacterium GW2011_GWC1_37_8]|uniref:CYTH domain-containing protein n=1 Tax=Candidatus Woesebacteria bacterium GW2011_GWB1_38_8 TaxID=1618570 RepID=A0A0G0LDY8_9BACT|nr:MAG: hypothetical protein US60_C0011G0017 [Microgenomates group bacterium GW2011_GWC1_37_8]KKQ86135.1 MAG: hypothetical protein UT08_C0001G0001 [Candidatus Woesebacteria bacterium GW2011_GWB1_38_8]